MASFISASILSADFTCLGEQIRLAEKAGVDWIHIDVMDGQFVPNITMGPFIVEACRRITTLPLDVHLMIENPEKHVIDFAAAGATNITVHVESNPNLHRTIEVVRSQGCKPGVVLNPGTSGTSVSAILPFVDLVLVMTVNPGYSGQVFIPQTMDKVAQIRAELDRINPGALVEVDGGITPETLPLALRAGARVFVAATSIFKHQAGVAAGVQSLRQVMVI